ncbi:MAG: FAD-dependent oxidoreductase [Anaerolineae bacterium]
MATYVIVGGVAGGATAAARLRRLDETADIVLLERGKYVSFANCGLPYHIGGTIPARDSLLVSTPEKLRAEFQIDVRPLSEAVRIDRQAKEVHVRPVDGGDAYRLAYDKLILAPGAKPFVPDLPGMSSPGVYTLRNIPDMDAINARLDEGEVSQAVVVGGGFIGLEMAENLVKRGVRVSVIEMLPQVMTALDADMAAPLHRHLREKGVLLSLNDGLQEVVPQANGSLHIGLCSGRTIPADMVILAIGVRPESDLARDAGLDLGRRGHICVNEAMQTSDSDIYAVGDAVEVLNPVTGSPTAIPLAGPANRQARIAADHITGRASRYPGTQGTFIVQVFDMAAAATGANSALLEQSHIDFVTSITHSQDHVSYYPGATPQTIKLLYAPGDGRLLGAQVVGYNAVDRTVDVLAMAIAARMTVFDLEMVELAYAPPYGSAKDPVNIAGYVAANHLRGDTRLVEWSDLAGRDPDRHAVLDVRTDIEWDLGHIEGALHIPNTDLRARLDELDRNKEWTVYCKVGRRAYVMERMLRQQGFQVNNLSGGWDTYHAATEAQSSPGGEDQEGGACALAVADAVTDATDVGMRPATNALVSTNALPAVHLDAQGLQCPGPIMAVYRQMQELAVGQILEVEATDPGFLRDVAAWCDSTGNTLLEAGKTDRTIFARLQKGVPTTALAGPLAQPRANAKTMVVFSGDLDRALASFIIANGAASMGQQVTMFFTFWGLNILRRRDPAPVKKNVVEHMFGMMLPKGADALKLSKLNMGGLGTLMMKGVMKAKSVDSLSSLLDAAQQSGVRLIACQMSMDIMGIKVEELIDGVEVGGVATMIHATDQANASWFI